MAEKQLEEQRVQGRWDKVARLAKQIESNSDSQNTVHLEALAEMNLRTDKPGEARKLLARAQRIQPRREVISGSTCNTPIQVTFFSRYYPNISIKFLAMHFLSFHPSSFLN
jgi:hypothetical protein